MKLNDYLINHSVLIRNQIQKNKKISQDYIKEKRYNSFKQSKYNTFNSIEIPKNREHLLNDENKLFLKLYNKTKKLYPTKINETFKDLINQYVSNNYKIPHFIQDKNLFNQNPLLLTGSELDQYYKNINRSSLRNKKTRIEKHVNFIKKEMLLLENIIYSRSNNNTNNFFNEDDDSNFKENKKQSNNNYFHVDSVWDKIKKTKMQIKNEKRSQKRIKQKLELSHESLKLNLNKNSKNLKKRDEIKSDEIYKSSTLNYIPSSKISENNISLNYYNSKDSITYNKKDSSTSDSKYKTFNSLRNFNKQQTAKIMSPMHSFKFKLLREEENNKILKEIEETKSTMNNKDLMEKNITVENYSSKTNKSKNIKNDNSINNSSIQNIFKRMRTMSNRSRIFKNLKFPTDKVAEPILLRFIGAHAIKQNIFRKLDKENNPKKIMEIYMKLNLDLFNHNEVEKLMKIYYEKIMGYRGNSIKKIIDLKLGDELICDLIEKYIEKTKDKTFKYSSREKLNKSLDKVNQEIISLKKRFFLGKTLESL